MVLSLDLEDISSKASARPAKDLLPNVAKTSSRTYLTYIKAYLISPLCSSKRDLNSYLMLSKGVLPISSPFRARSTVSSVSLPSLFSSSLAATVGVEPPSSRAFSLVGVLSLSWSSHINSSCFLLPFTKTTSISSFLISIKYNLNLYRLKRFISVVINNYP
uniref:Uncharacterized protein n=1 Tax=Rhynchosporium secalis TaxID=38038 RepID=V5W680_RHYSE|nr:hypothetical protein [Rhynchosporium secalis]AHC02441.1 hypothetical protein [Rhynchosporium secalis]